jgi:tryptophan synthase alpha chain
MSNRIDDIFASLRAQHQLALMPFVTAGYPSLEITAVAIPALERAGASVVEIGFPFSDPIADGPVIASSMHQALKAGVIPDKVFDLIHAVRHQVKIGLVAMVSDSIITRMGPEVFLSKAKQAGFDGVIVPDIDLDAAQPFAGLARVYDLTFTMLIAPTTPERRIESIASRCTGFIYLLARAGVTGESAEIDRVGLAERIVLIRKHTALPIAVGFGISRPEHVEAVASIADAAIVGSALIRRMSDPRTAVHQVVQLIEGLRRHPSASPQTS